MIIDIVLVSALGRGGLEKSISRISEELIKRGYKARVIQIFKPKYDNWRKELSEFYVLTNYEFTRNITVEKMIELYKEFLINNEKPNVILATHIPASAYLWSQSLSDLEGNNIPIISWVHGPLPAYGDNYEELLSFAYAHLAISKELENQLVSLKDKAPVYLINNPIINKNIEMRRDEEKFRILYVGRLEREKRVDLLLDALKNIKGEWFLDIVGDGVERESLELRACRNEIDCKIKWHGWSDNPWEEIDKANLLVITSEQEGFGLVMIEALALGIPVLSTRTEGAVSIIKHNINGWIIDVNDICKLEYYLRRVCEKEILLPSREDCMNSVKEYEVCNVVDNLENALKIEMARKSNEYKKRKVIDIVINYLSGNGGTENVLITVINNLIKKGYRVRIIQVYKTLCNEWLKKCNCEVYSLFANENTFLFESNLFIEGYESIMKRFDEPNLMIATGIPKMSYLCDKVRKKLGKDIPVVSWIHNPLRAFENFYDIEYADYHMAISREIYEEIESLNLNKEIYLTYNPVGISEEKIKLSNSKLKILYMGRLANKQKNVSMLFNALDGLEGEWKLDIFGDGEDKSWLRGLAKAIEINENIYWHGWKQNPWTFIKEASILVLTSKFEGFGLVIVEALSRGIPVISTECGIASEIIKNGYNGWLIKDKDVDGLKKIFQDILDKKVSMPLKDNCVNSVKKFNAKHVMENIKKNIDIIIK